MQFVDIGANLAHDSFDADRDAVLRRARDAGVSQIVVTGSCAQSSRRALDLAEAYPEQLHATAGLHPHHADDFCDEHVALFRELAERPKLVAIGETGLDYFRNYSSAADQERSFIRHLELAAELKKPLFLHQRDAHERFLPILKEHRDSLGNIVVHCFTGDRAEMNAYLELDLHIGLTGWICDERRGQHMHEFIGDIPLERLMIETDSPYLLPRTLCPKPKTRRNEPQWLPAVAQTVSEVRKCPLGEVARATRITAGNFFGLAVSEY